MEAVDRDFHLAKALVVDVNATSRSLMSAQLRDLGVASVRQVSRIEEARLVLENGTYDIVLCAVGDDDVGFSGQDLLDELRRERLLPHSTVFFLVAGMATYAQVQEAAESTVDGYLVKPYSGSALFERLREARRRKRSMDAVYAAMHQGDLARAAALAQARFDSRAEYWVFAGQLASELWLRADQPAHALALCHVMNALQPQAWSRLGVARAKLAGGEVMAAREMLLEVVVQLPDVADTHDLLGRVFVEQGDFEPALQSFRKALDLSVGCLLRMQHCGTMAFYLGRKDESMADLERTVLSGRKSKLFDALCLSLISLLRFDRGDMRGLLAVCEQINRMCANFPESMRLQTMRSVAQALVGVLSGKPDEALVVARELASRVKERSTDLEGASLTLGLWSRLQDAEVPLMEFDTLLRSIGMRFCVSRACCEVLLASTNGKQVAQTVLRSCQARVNAMAEKAIDVSLSGHAEMAVTALLREGESTRNAKLIDMAGALVRRNASKLNDSQSLLQRVQAAQNEYCSPLTHIAGVRRSARTPGGVVLRT